MSEHIIRGADLAIAGKLKNYSAWIRRIGRQRIKLFPMWTGEVVDNFPALARIDAGFWIADCKLDGCAGAEVVDPDEPVFFCLSCGNKSIGSKARQVIFPENYREIERLILARPVRTEGSDPLIRAVNAVPVYPKLGRFWEPGETLEMIIQQNRGME